MYKYIGVAVHFIHSHLHKNTGEIYLIPGAENLLFAILFFLGFIKNLNGIDNNLCRIVKSQLAAVNTEIIIPVSYTHLDVYKRQIWMWYLDWKTELYIIL